MSTVLGKYNGEPVLHITSTEEDTSSMVDGSLLPSTIYSSKSINTIKVNSTFEGVIGNDTLNFTAVPGFTDQPTYFTVIPGLLHNDYVAKQRYPHAISVYSDSISVIGMQHLDPICNFRINNNNNDYVLYTGSEISIASIAPGGIPNAGVYIGFNISSAFGNYVYNNRVGLKVRVTWFDISINPDSTIDTNTPTITNSVELSNRQLLINGSSFDSNGLLLARRLKSGTVSSNYNIYSGDLFTTDHSIAISNSTWPVNYTIRNSTFLYSTGVGSSVSETAFTSPVVIDVVGGTGVYSAVYKEKISILSGETYSIPHDSVCVISLAPELDGSLFAATASAPVLKLSDTSTDGIYIIQRYHSSAYIFTTRTNVISEFRVVKSGTMITYTYTVDDVVQSATTQCNIFNY